MNSRMNRTVFFLLIFAFLGMLGAPLYGQNMKLEHQLIDNLEIEIATPQEGSAESMQQTIKSRLKTKTGDLFSQQAFDADLKLLSQDYDRIEPVIESKEGGISIVLRIWSNPVIRKVEWVGNRQICCRDLQKELEIGKGALFDRQKFNKAFHKIKAYYVKEGFFEAELNYDVEYDACTNEVVVIITIEEGRAGKIKQICFKNFTKCEQEILLEMMVTKKYTFFLSWFTGEGLYNEEMIQHDEFVILNYLQNEGYADAKVTLTVTEACEKDRIIITIAADKGQKYYFGNITIEGNELYCEQELRERIRICAGDPFSPDKIHDTMRHLTNYYGKHGYIEAYINYEPKLADNGCVYDVKITIEEGEQYHVGMIKVIGNCSTQTKVILHETLLVPGEVFNLEKLQITEKRLVNIGYFENVNVYAVKSEEACVLPGNYRDVHIEVEEASTGHLGAFFGFSTVENMFGGVNLTERNFNVEGFKNIWTDGFRALRGGGEYAHITLSFGKKSSSYVLSWTKPYFMDTPWSVGFDLDKTYNEYISDDYHIKGYGLNIHAAYECNAFLRVGTHYRIRYTHMHVNDEAGKKLKEEAKNSGLISALGLSWNYDSTNHPLKPTRGLKSRVEGEIAGLGGKHSFLSVAYLNSYYFDLWGYGILKARGDLRFIQPTGKTSFHDLPIEERLFLGGDNSIRGYRSYRLGPKFDHDKEDPKGGASMQIFSLELSQPLFSRADTFIFFDSGSISDKNWDFGRFYHSYGYGLRLQVFENGPPLTVGMGYPINPAHSNDVKKFFITVGGKF